MDVTLKQLRYFVAVAHDLSFTRAAGRLHISQPTLSVQIGNLERQIGAELFNRTSRTVELTAAGRGLHDDARRLLADLEQAGERARRTHAAEAATVRIVHTASVAYEALPLILAEVHELPDVGIVAQQVWNDQALDAIRLGDAHLALVREFDGGEGLQAEVVRREPLVALMSARHALAGRDRLFLDDLRDQTVLVVPRALAPGFNGLISRLCAGRGFVPAQEELSSTGNREPVFAQLARQDDRLFIGPASMARLRWNGVCGIPIADDRARMSIDVVWADRPLPPGAGRVLDAIRRVSRREGWPAG